MDDTVARNSFNDALCSLSLFNSSPIGLIEVGRSA
jgi:hypothetical protein